MKSSIELGVNIDHVATLRQQRHTPYPDPVQAALVAERAGADNITLHLREDRRHIQERDVRALAGRLRTRMNLEMAASDELVALACELRPPDCCLVPEKRAELTTEAGLDVIAAGAGLRAQCARLRAAGVRVALFIAADAAQIDASADCGAPVVELHTGNYADAAGETQARELERLRSAARHARARGLEVHAGHGLHYGNVQAVAAITEIVELNIGHAIVARAVFDGMAAAVRATARARELRRIAGFAEAAAGAGFEVHAGHGLNLHNVAAIAAIPAIVELNIGHSIVARALYVGFPKAVKEMRQAMGRAGRSGRGAAVPS